MNVKKIILWAIVVVGITTVFLHVTQVPERHISLSEHTTNAGEITSGVLVGQTITANRDNLSAIAIKFATYSDRANTHPVIFLLREWPDGADIRTGEVNAAQLQDNTLYRFRFDPIPDSNGKTFFFSITSLTSTPGNAITVDLDARDPYQHGSAFIVRGQDTSDQSVIARAGKPRVDVVFETYYDVPLRVAATNYLVRSVRTFIDTWDERQGLYIIYAKVLFSALGLLAFAFWVQRIATEKLTPKRTTYILFGLVLAALLVRWWYATELPITEDEGNYLYDARMLREGALAGGDGYVKAPLVIAWIAFWQFIASDTVLAGRLSSLVIGALALFPLYILGKELVSRNTGLLAAALWAVVGTPAVFTIYTHTQPVAMFMISSGLAVLVVALKNAIPHFSHVVLRSQLLWLFTSGILLGFGVTSRKSSLAVGVAVLLLMLFKSTSWREKIQHILVVGAGFLLVIALFLTGAGLVYGQEGIFEAIGINSAEDGLFSTDPAEAEQVREYSLRGMTPFFRESLPLILLATLGLGVLAERVLRQLLQRVSHWLPDRQWLLHYILPKLGWLPALAVFWWAWGFFLEYEGPVYHEMFGIQYLWYVMVIVLIVFALWPRRSNITTNVTNALSAFVVPVGWLIGLLFFYLNWLKFHVNYVGEFLPPLVLLSAIGLSAVLGQLSIFSVSGAYRRLMRLAHITVFTATTATLLWAFFVSNFITLYYEHTGTFFQKSIDEAARWAKDNIPLDEPIFTGATLIPYTSGHHTALNIAHSRWYAYEFTRKNTKRLNTFLPPIPDMLQAYRESEWFLLDKQTGFSFLMEYSEIEAGLEKDWEQVHGIENGSNTLTFYRRVR